MPADGPSYPPLPTEFLFGVATADHQCEAYDEQYHDVFDAWEQELGLTPRGRATDFWDRYTEDVELARGLGCSAFRLSLAWSRLEPEPGVWNEEAFEHYRQMLDAIRAAGMEPVVTLLHFTWPLHVQQRGGMLDERFPDWFKTFAAECARRLGDRVRYWITLNEPTLLPFGYVKFWWERHYRMPPGMGEATTEEQVEAAVHLMRTLFLAHTAARAAIKEVHPEAQVSANPFVLGLPERLQDWFDRRLTRLRRVDVLKRHAHREVRRPVGATGGADVTLSMLTFNPQRAREVLFTQPYYCAQPVLLTRKDADEAALEGDWAGVVAILEGATAEGLVATVFPRARVRRVKTLDEGMRVVEQGGVFLDHDTRLGPIAQQQPERFRLCDTALPTQPYAAAVALGDTDLLDAVDRAIRGFVESGRWSESVARHFPALPSADPPRRFRRVSLSGPPAPPCKPGRGSEGAALRTIRRRGRLVVAVRDDAPGFSHRNAATGELEGLEIDLARSVARHLLGNEGRVQFRIVRSAARLRSVRAPWSRWLEPLQKLYSLTSALFNTHWWHLGLAGRLPEFLCPRECVGQQDFVGLDYYWGVDSLRPRELLRLQDATEQRYESAPVSPAGLYATLKRLARLFPGQAILIVENGCVESADGVTRAHYLRDHVRQVQRACQEGLPLIGYICWSITSNREWGLPFRRDTDFGLHHIDLDHDPDLRRVPTDASTALREIIARRGA